MNRSACVVCSLVLVKSEKKKKRIAASTKEETEYCTVTSKTDQASKSTNKTNFRLMCDLCSNQIRKLIVRKTTGVIDNKMSSSLLRSTVAS